MKKTVEIIIASLMLVVMTGCGDASAKLSNPNEVLFSIDGTKYTKNDLYQQMIDYDAGDNLIKTVAKQVVNLEIETTDEITAKAQADYQDLLDMYNTDIETILNYLGYASEEALMDDLIASAKVEMLADKYIEENLDSLFDEYKPLLYKMITISTQENETETYEERAALALAELRDGVNFETVVEKYGDATAQSSAAETLYTVNSSLDSNVRSFLETVTSPTLSSAITAAGSTETLYIVQVTSTNRTQVKDKLVDYLKNTDNFSTDLYAVYFKKHNFRVYDIDIYNSLNDNYPEFLVQDSK